MSAAQSHKTTTVLRGEKSLLRPDDSLVAHEDLAAMALPLLPIMSSMPCNVTKLVLPTKSTAQLDPSQLPRTESGNTIYHVTTDDTDTQVT